MLTIERFEAELKTSEQKEEQTYKELTLDLYNGLQSPLKTLYDQMVRETNNLTSITTDATTVTPSAKTGNWGLRQGESN